MSCHLLVLHLALDRVKSILVAFNAMEENKGYYTVPTAPVLALVAILVMLLCTAIKVQVSLSIIIM